MAVTVTLALLLAACGTGTTVSEEPEPGEQSVSSVPADQSSPSAAGSPATSFDADAQCGELGNECDEEATIPADVEPVDSGEGSGAAAETSAPPPASSTAVTNPPATEPVPAGVPREVIDSLIAYAAQQLVIDPGDVRVEQASPWSWPDTAFGCPEPGKTYSQVVTDGYWVILEAHGQTLDLRVALDGAVTECRLPEDRSP
jgi:hypothetical protein